MKRVPKAFIWIGLLSLLVGVAGLGVFAVAGNTPSVFDEIRTDHRAEYDAPAMHQESLSTSDTRQKPSESLHQKVGEESQEPQTSNESSEAPDTSKRQAVSFSGSIEEQGLSSCQSNESPTFTAAITDVASINVITPPATVVEGNQLKTHSFIHTVQGNRVPVYMPVNGTLVEGVHLYRGLIQGDGTDAIDPSAGSEYVLRFDVTCEIWFLFDHITDPINDIRAVFPSEAAKDSRSVTASEFKTFKAGDLLGYTTGTDLAGSWDFGVYNRNNSNSFPAGASYEVSSRDQQARCGYDFFTEDIKSQLYGKFDREYGVVEVPLPLCTSE